MANITAAQVGNWSAGATWVGGVPPGNGDTATSAYDLTVNSNVTVGTSQAAGQSTAISMTAGATLTIAAGVTLTVRGEHIQSGNGGDLVLEAGSILEYDSSLAPPGTCYRVQLSTQNWDISRLICHGTSGSKCTIRSNANGGNAYIYSDTVGGGTPDCLHTNFLRMGNGTNPSLYFFSSGNAVIRLRNCEFNAGGRVANAGYLFLTDQVVLENTTFKNTDGSYCVIFIGDALEPTTGTRDVQNCVFDKAGQFWYMRGLTVVNCICDYRFEVLGHPSTISSCLIQHTDSSSRTFIDADVEDSYLLSNSTGFPDQGPFCLPKWTLTEGTNYHVSRNVMDPMVAGREMISVGTHENNWTYWFEENIMIPKVNGDCGVTLGCVNTYNWTNRLIRCIDNTMHRYGMINYVIWQEEGQPAPAGRIAEFKGNLVWDWGANGGYKIIGQQQVFDDVIDPAGAHHNAGFNLITGTNGKSYDQNLFSGALPGTNDVDDIDPDFVDASRNMATWDATLGGPGTYSHALAELKKLNDVDYDSDYNVADLVAYVRGGFVPQAAELIGTSWDDGTIGAMEGTPAPPTVNTVRTTIGTLANQNVDIQSISGTGPWDVTLAAPPSADCKIGDTLSDEAATPNLYLITAINGSILTVRDAFGEAAAPVTGASQAFTKRSYATITDWKTDLDDTGIYAVTDDAIGDVCETLTFTTDITIDTGGTIGLDSIALQGHPDYRLAGSFGTGVRIENTTGQGTLTISTAVPTRISWLEFYRSSATVNFGRLISVSGSALQVTIDHCMIRGLRTAYEYACGSAIYGEVGTLHVDSCVISKWGNPTNNSGCGIELEYINAASTVRNNTVYDCVANGIIAMGGAFDIRNNIAMANDAGDMGATTATNCSHNCTSDASALGTSSLINQVLADTLVDAPNGNLHLKQTANARGVGTLVGDSLDIDGQTRTVPVDIGADFIPLTPQVFAPYQRDREMFARQIATATHPIKFFVVLASDHVTGVTGLAPVATICKSGASSFSAAAGSISEIGQGWYSWGGNATDRDTEGDLTVHITAATADPVDFKVPIVTHDPFDESAGGGTALETSVQETKAAVLAIQGLNFSAAFALDNQATLTQLKAQLTAALTEDVHSLPTGVPGTSLTLLEMLGWLSLFARNELVVDRNTNQLAVKNDAGQTIASAPYVETATDFTRGKFVTAS